MQKQSIKTSSFSPGFGWNASAARYTDLKTGRFVKAKVVRDTVDALILKSSESIRVLSQKLVQGWISLANWELQIASELKFLHIANQVAALGGLHNYNVDAENRAFVILENQFSYLHRFATQIANGDQKLSGVLSRIDLYVHAARATYEAERNIVMQEAGYTYESSILHSGDSCQGCLGENAKGFQPIGTLIPIGERDCLTRCHCTLDYRKGNQIDV